MVLLPRRFTPPLAGDFPSAADRWLPVVQAVWQKAFGYRLEDWQVWLIRSVFEVYPAGHPLAGQLRFRQAVTSCPRQNGKSELTAAITLIGLLRAADSLVISLASSIDQARIIFTKVLRAVQRTPELAAMFRAVDTETRGIRGVNGSNYMVRPAKSAALQGLAVTLGICDELHLLDTHSWTDLVSGTGGRPNALVFGVSTAGTDSSGLLKHLYGLGEKAIGDPATRVGFWVWETEDAEVPDDDGELLAKLRTANPAMHTGRMDDEAILADVRSLPVQDIQQYRFNRFVASSGGYIPSHAWQLCAVDGDERPPVPSSGAVFCLDRTPDWGFATVTASWKLPDGKVWTEVVRSLVNPSPDDLKVACLGLSRFAPRALVLDGYASRNLGDELKKLGLPVVFARSGDVIAASSLLYGKVVNRELVHAGDPLLSAQLPGARRRNVGDAYKVSRQDSSVSIDAVMATLLGVYFADSLADNAPTLVV